MSEKQTAEELRFEFAMKWRTSERETGELVIAVNQETGRIYEVASSTPLRSYVGGSQEYMIEHGSRLGIAKDIGIADSGNVYVLQETGEQLISFDQEGNLLDKWVTADNKIDLTNPRGIAIDRQGNVLITDDHRVQVFGPSGQFLYSWGSPGRSDGQFNEPARLALDSQNNVYVADSGNNRIQVFDQSGMYLSQWGNEGALNGELNCPYGLAVDSNDNVYVADFGNHRIQVFRPDGTYQCKWGSHGDGDGQFQAPWLVRLDSYDNVYVINKYLTTTQMFRRIR